MAENTAFDKNFFKKYSLAIVSIGILVVFLFIVLYLNSKSKDGSIVFPAGVNYLSPEEEEQAAKAPAGPTIDFKAWAEGAWVPAYGVNYDFTYQIPAGLQPLYFPNDQTEKVAFAGNAKPAELNILLEVETISNYDAKSVGDIKNFAEEVYWKQFGGFKSPKEGTEFQTTSGLDAYSVRYEIIAGGLSGEHVFVAMPDDDDHVIHLVNQFPRDYKENIFDRIVNSVRMMTQQEINKRQQDAAAAAAALTATPVPAEEAVEETAE